MVIFAAHFSKTGRFSAESIVRTPLIKIGGVMILVEIMACHGARGRSGLLQVFKDSHESKASNEREKGHHPFY